jgi:hypothetical protein
VGGVSVVPAGQPGATYGDLDLEQLLSRQKKEWLPAMNDLVASGRIRRVGRGRKNDPYTFWRPPNNSIPGFHSNPGTETAQPGSVIVSGFRSNPVGGNGNETPTGTTDPHSIPIPGTETPADELAERILVELDATELDAAVEEDGP